MSIAEKPLQKAAVEVFFQLFNTTAVLLNWAAIAPASVLFSFQLAAFCLVF